MTSGIVKTISIGQSAGLLPKLVMIEYGRASTTERVLVSNDGVINLNLLKIQSSPIWKQIGINGMLNQVIQ